MFLTPIRCLRVIARNMLNQKPDPKGFSKFMRKFLFLPLPIITFVLISCKESGSQNDQNKEKASTEKSTEHPIDSSTVYETENLIIKKLSNHIYEHISYLNTDDFGRVDCNGMLVVNDNQGVIFDTPTDDQSALELINYVTNDLKCEIMAVVPTHFHEDCIGGIKVFEKHNIQTYASEQTMELLKKNGQRLSRPVKMFNDSLTLKIGNEILYVEYFGEGHTKDNVIGYFPEDHAIFGGCLVKTLGASKGYLGDANTEEWSKTVKKIKLKYPKTKIVIPGHGSWGGAELFDYTITLF